MVTIHDVHAVMKKYYRIYGEYHVQEPDLKVWVKGHVILQEPRPDPGVQFEEITGDYGAVAKGLTTLVGLPPKLGGALIIAGNPLKNLLGAPQVVGEDIDMSYMPQIMSLEGAPTHVTGEWFIQYHDHQPLLRCLAAQKVTLRQPEQVTAKLFDKQLRCEEILNDPAWIGKGKSHMLNCALALKKAGLDGNAQW